MKSKDFAMYASVLFFFAGSLHVIRAFSEWQLMIGEFAVPAWFSWLLGLIALYMSYTGYRLSK